MLRIFSQIVFWVDLAFIFTCFSYTRAANPSTHNEENFGDRPVHYTLLKLLDFQLEGNKLFANLIKDLEDGIHLEFERDLGGNTEKNGHPSVRAERSNEGNRKDYKVIIEVLKELKSNVAELKKNMPVKTETSPSPQMVDLGDLETACYPIGVDKYRFCRRGYPLNRRLEMFPKSCKELLDRGNNVSGVYLIHPKGFERPLKVLCDMETRGGGWIHIQKRFDGSEDFFREWRDYKHGFGDLAGEFWLGLENMNKLTGASKELLIEIVDREGTSAYFHYRTFQVGSEVDGYVLEILSGHSGDLNDSMAYSVGKKFSTKDFDRTKHCSKKWSGGWWYGDCFEACLNGRYMNTDLPHDMGFSGIHWFNAKDNRYNYAKSRMMIRTIEE